VYKMSHVIEIDDEEYARLEQAAQQRGTTAEALLRAWMKSVTTTGEEELRAARARWAALGPSVGPPTEADLRAHPLLRVIGIGALNEPGWADQHDAVFGGCGDM
jgi:hypothetical protein